MKRTPLQRRTPLRSVKPLDRPPTKLTRSSSLKRSQLRRKKARSAETADFWVQRREELFARCGGRCEVGGCSLVDLGMQAHHRKLRSGGPDHAITNLLALCPEHHRWVHAKVAEARQTGHIVSRYADPATTPVHLPDGHVVFLTPDGRYSPTPPEPEPQEAA